MYKRQAFYRVVCHHIVHSDVLTYFANKIEESEIFHPVVIVHQFGTVRSVSYTHLDVYKRQDEWTLSKEEVEIAMKGELDNIRAWGTYLSTIKYNCDVIMGATFKVEDNEKTGDRRIFRP